MKKCVLVLLMFTFLFVASAEPFPIYDGGWYWRETQVLNGREFYTNQVDLSYREQDGWAYIKDFGKIHYFLYDTYTYHNGNEDELTNSFIPVWIESMGYVIDFDNIRREKPNNDLASSVKALMAQRNCDVSVALITSYYEPYVVINRYDYDEDIYWTDIIPVIK